MAFTHRQTVGSVYGGGSSQALSFTISVNAGELVVLRVTMWKSTTVPTLTSVTDDQGNSYTIDEDQYYNPGGSNFGHAIAHSVVATGGTLTVTANFSATVTVGNMAISCYSAGASISVDQTNENGSSSTAPDSGSVTTATGAVLMCGVMVHDGSTTAITPDGSWTQRFENENGSSELASSMIDRLGTGAITDSASWSLGASRIWLAGLFTFKEASGAIDIDAPPMAATLAAPAPTAEMEASPPPAASTLAASAPAVEMEALPPTAALTLAAPAPSASMQAAPPAGALTLAAPIPGVGLVASPPAGTLTLEMPAPEIPPIAVGASDYLENALLDHVFGAVPYAPPAMLYLALYTTAPGDPDVGGVEVSAAGYARLPVTNDRQHWTDAELGKANAIAFAWGIPAEAWGDVLAIGVLDAPAGGNLLAWKDFASIAVPIGGAVTIAAGNLTLTLD